MEVLAGPATVDVPAPATGRLAEIRGQEDDRVMPGSVLGLVATEEEDAAGPADGLDDGPGGPSDRAGGDPQPRRSHDMTTFHERSAGVIPYRRADDQGPLYLVLHSATVRNPRAKWEFPKGGVEPGETTREAAAREFHEETSLVDWSFHDGFERTLSYTYIRRGRKIVKTVTYYLVEVRDASPLARSARAHGRPRRTLAPLGHVRGDQRAALSHQDPPGLRRSRRVARQVRPLIDARASYPAPSPPSPSTSPAIDRRNRASSPKEIERRLAHAPRRELRSFLRGTGMARRHRSVASEATPVPSSWYGLPRDTSSSP